jgi:hypothetical protein
MKKRRFQKAPKLPPGARSTALSVPRQRVGVGESNVMQEPSGPTQYQARNQPQPPPFIADVDPGRNIYSPLQPVQPFGPPWITTTRQWDYISGYNIDIAPAHVVFMQSLRLMAQSWGPLATIIQTRIDQFMRMPIDIQIRDKPKVKNARIDEIKAFFRMPDKKTLWDPWVRSMLYELLVTDAVSIDTSWRANDGKPFAVTIIDGATIKPLIDDMGRRPDAPSPAYQQLIKGLPMVNLTEDELIYAPMRPRPQMPIYGYPPTEQIIVNIASGIARETYQAKFWRDGTMPEMIMSCPEGWNPQQVAQFQGMFDSIMAGNTQTKSRVRFVPTGMKPFDIKNANGEGLKADIDEWLVRVACYAYSVSPSPFIRQMNRATAQTAQDEAQEEGLHPLMTWFKDSIMNRLIQDPRYGFGYDDIEFVYKPEKQVDPLVEMQTLVGYAKEGVLTRNEIRGSLDYEDMPGGDELTVDTPNGPVPLAETLEANRAQALAVPDQIDQANEAHDAQMQQMKSGPPAVGKAARATFRQSASPGTGRASQEHDGRCRCNDCLVVGKGAFEAGRARRRAFAGYSESFVRGS